MFKTIMWATDGTPNADRALPYAKALAQQEGATLIIAHVIERYASHKASGLAVHADEEQVEAKLKELEAKLSGEGLNVALKIVNHVGPQPAHEIADLARDSGSDLILVGCRGHGAIPGLVLGSVTQRLLHVSPCPVLVVPPGEVSASGRAARKVGAAADRESELDRSHLAATGDPV
jgi:nucleotide-binding universal stress UspA family protein